LGDSAYILLRPLDDKIEKVFRSATQQHRFNAPYQTGTEKAWPTRAFSTEHIVQNDDIVVMGSDGIFDNLFDEDIICCLEK
jgi:protein phosphatase PTC7